MPLLINELYVFIASEEPDEGIAAIRLNDTMFPLIGADAARVENLRGMAQALADETGKTLTLAHFAVRENMATITPRKRTP